MGLLFSAILICRNVPPPGIAAVIETTAGVDYARRIELQVNGQLFDETIPVDRDALIAAGDHELKLMLGEI